ncbi:hypothetical protein [Lapillicoccus jejuensis]|uniref:Uncharacterized protein n=1 Tax=Lapillicoccus jejuensis TaxID=402171 RepID=A0A542DXW1_9MICO|nr:hypothetical protein [Lapillicoccus jejuensis]TQJ07917.1 hypothetical protein FB458_0988 [Lapillicoccus jejuensis]
MAGSPTPARAARRAVATGATAPRTVLVAALVVAASVLLEALALARVLGRLVDLPAAGGLTAVAAAAGLVAGVGAVVVPAHHARHTLGELATRALATGLAATLVVGAAAALATTLLHRPG